MARTPKSEGPVASPMPELTETLVQLSKLVQDLGARLTAENLEMRARLHQMEFRLGTLERQGQAQTETAPPATGRQRKGSRGARADASAAAPARRGKKSSPARDPQVKARARLAQELKASRDSLSPSPHPSKDEAPPVSESAEAAERP
jgi:hypothetical protein